MRNLSIFTALALLSSFLSAAQIPNLAWTKGWGGIPANEWGSAIATDAAGAVYTTGCFNGAVDFDPGPATLYLSSVGNGDIFISKLSASGNLVWVKTLGGPGWDIGSSMKIDGAGNIYVAGTFAVTADFDPGPGIQNLTSPNSSQDAFLVKLSPAGDFIWARQVARGNFDESVYSMALDAQSNVLITGSFLGTPDFDPGTGTAFLASSGAKDVFVSKFDSAGSLKWVRKWGNADDDEANEIVLDGAGNIYTTGFFGGTVDFDPSAAIYPLTAAVGAPYNSDVFVSKLDTAGNFRWARRLGGKQYDKGAALAIHNTDIIVGGYFTDSGDFDPGAGTTTLVATGNKDVFLTKLDTAGGFVWAKSFGGYKTDQCFSLTTDAVGHIYTTGWFTGIVDLDPGAGTAVVSTSNQDWDMYLSKFDTQGNLVWGVNGGSGPGATEPGFILLAPTDALYVTGAFTGTADFDPWTGTATLVTVANPTSIYDIFLAKYNTVCPPINASVTVTGSTLSVSPTPGAVYQWLACDGGNAPIAGQNASTFTATTGNYALVVSSQLCTDTSACTYVFVCPPLNTAVSVGGNALTVSPNAGATYQWLDCTGGNVPVPGQTANVFTPVSSGHYSVEVRTAAGCADTSACTAISVNSISTAPRQLHSLRVFPNAFSDEINAEWFIRLARAEISILDPLGRIVQAETVVNAASARVNTASLSPGNYVLRVSSDGTAVSRPVIKVGWP